jgi:ribonuclease G
MKKCYINAVGTARRIALVGESGLERLHLEEQSRGTQTAGSIYVGRVTKVLPGMQAAFVDIGAGKNGYLHRDDLVSLRLASSSKEHESISKLVREGEEIVVQIEKEGIGTKGPKLTAIIELGGEYLVYLPHGNYTAVSKKMTEETREKWRTFAQKHREGQEGLVVRTSAQDASEEQVLQEWRMLKERCKQMMKLKGEKKAPAAIYEARDFVLGTVEQLLRQTGACELYVDDHETYRQLHQKGLNPHGTIVYYQKSENIFRHYRVEPEIEKLLKKAVWLKNGAYILIEQTEAMVVIDVNTGKFSGKASERHTILQTNLEAAKEIANQLKLRNLGGMILIDFINMKEREDRQAVMEEMQLRVKHDETRTTVVGFTELGVLQLTRKKVKESIEAALTKPCPVCGGSGRVLSAETIAYQIEREVWEHRRMDEEAIWIDTTASVIDILKKDSFLAALEKMAGCRLFLTVRHDCHDSYSIRHIGSIETIEERIRNAQ